MLKKFPKIAALLALSASFILLGTFTAVAYGESANAGSVRPGQGSLKDRPHGGKHGERWKELESRLEKVRERVLSEQVGLDAVRKAQVEKILLKFHAKKRELGKQLRQSRQEVRRLLAADSQDQKAYAQLLASIDKTTEAMERLAHEEGAELAQVMTPKERAKLGQALQKMQRQMRGAFRRYQERSGGNGPRDNQATDSK